MTSGLAVVIPCAGRTDLLQACLFSIARHKGLCQTKAIVVLDSPEIDLDEATSELIENSDFEIIRHDQNYGIAKSWNDGIRIALGLGYEFINVLNDDTEVAKNFDSCIVDFLIAHRAVMFCSQPDRRTASWVWPDLCPTEEGWGSDPWPATPGIVDYQYPGGLNKFVERFRKLPDELAWAPCRLNGASFVVRKQTIEEVGLFDERYLSNFEDYDFYLRTLRRYGPLAIGTHAGGFVHHLRAATVGFLPKSEIQPRIDQSRQHFLRTWKDCMPMYEWLQAVNTIPANRQLSLGPPWPNP